MTSLNVISDITLLNNIYNFSVFRTSDGDKHVCVLMFIRTQTSY